MTVLADSINLPLVAAFGLIVFAPLTLLVTVIEAFTFRCSLGAPFRSVFRGVLVANVLSTLAGAIILGIQDFVVHGTGITRSIPAFVRGYAWVAMLMVVLYFGKSLLVEGLWLGRRRFIDRIERPRGAVFRTVLLGNLLSYCAVGPLFYVANRPYFAGVETTFDTRWTRNGDTVVYYIDGQDGYIKRVQLDGTEARTLAPYPATSFLVSADESALVYAGKDGQLYAFRAGRGDPVLLPMTGKDFFMTHASLSPDNRRVALRDSGQRPLWSTRARATDTVKVVDLDSGRVEEIGTVPADSWDAPISWSADGSTIFASAGSVHAFAADSRQPPIALETPPDVSSLVENYLCAQGLPTLSSNRGAFKELPTRAQQGEYAFDVYPYLGSHIRIQKSGKTLLFLQNAYGLLNLGMPPVDGAVFLPSGNELLLDWWDQTYVLGLEPCRLGLVADGNRFVLRTPAFRLSFKPDDSQ